MTTKAKALPRAAKPKAASALDAPSPGKPPEAAPAIKAAVSGKLGELLRLVRRKTGASIEELIQATKWQAHSVRGAISGTLRKRLGLTVECTKTDGTTRYRIVS